MPLLPSLVHGWSPSLSFKEDPATTDLVGDADLVADSGFPSRITVEYDFGRYAWDFQNDGKALRASGINSIFEGASSEFSISLWISRDSVITTDCIISCGDLDYGIQLLLNDDGSVEFLVSDSSSSYSWKTPQYVIEYASTFYHIVLTYDNNAVSHENRVKIYIGGVSQSLTFTQNGSITSINTNANDFVIGTNGTDHYDGKIDSVALYNDSLPQSSITDIFNFGREGGLPWIGDDFASHSSIIGESLTLFAAGWSGGTHIKFHSHLGSTKVGINEDFLDDYIERVMDIDGRLWFSHKTGTIDDTLSVYRNGVRVNFINYGSAILTNNVYDYVDVKAGDVIRFNITTNEDDVYIDSMELIVDGPKQWDNYTHFWSSSHTPEENPALSDLVGDADLTSVSVTRTTNDHIYGGGYGYSWYFGGTGKRLTTQSIDKSVFAGTGAKFSLSTWISPDSYTSSRYIAGSDLQWYIRYLSNRKIEINVRQNSSADEAIFTSSLTLSSLTYDYNHVAFSYDASQPNSADRLRLWINGNEDLSFTTSVFDDDPVIGVHGSYFGIGSYGNSTSATFLGEIDNLAIAIDHLWTDFEVSRMASRRTKMYLWRADNFKWRQSTNIDVDAYWARDWLPESTMSAIVSGKHYSGDPVISSAGGTISGYKAIRVMEDDGELTYDWYGHTADDGINLYKNGVLLYSDRDSASNAFETRTLEVDAGDVIEWRTVTYEDDAYVGNVRFVPLGQPNNYWVVVPILLQLNSMLLDIIAKNSVDRSITFKIIDTSGSAVENVDASTSGLELWYRKQGGVKTTISVSDLISVDASHSDGGIIHIDDGYYRLDLPDLALSGDVDHVDFGGNIPDCIVIGGRIRLTDIDLDNEIVQSNTKQINDSESAAVRLGISANQIIPGTVDSTAFTSTTTEFESDDITNIMTDNYNGRVIIFTAGNIIDQATRIVDYSIVSGRGHFTVVALSEAPANDSTFIII